MPCSGFAVTLPLLSLPCRSMASNSPPSVGIEKFQSLLSDIRCSYEVIGTTAMTTTEICEAFVQPATKTLPGAPDEGAYLKLVEEGKDVERRSGHPLCLTCLDGTILEWSRPTRGSSMRRRRRKGVAPSFSQNDEWTKGKRFGRHDAEVSAGVRRSLLSLQVVGFFSRTCHRHEHAHAR